MVSARSNLVGRLGVFRRASAGDFSVGFRAAVAVELPGVADFLNFIKIQIGDEELILVTAGLLDDFAARIAEIALAVELADLPGSFGADAVDGGDKISVGDGVGGLLELPKIFGEAGDGGGRVIDDFRAVLAEDARAFREVAVVADVHADAGVASLEYGVAGISGREVKLFPKAGVTVRNVVLAIFAEVAAVGVDHGGGVEVEAGHLDFVDGDDQHHLVLLRELLHLGDSGAGGDFLGGLVPTGLLFGAKIRAVEKFLEAEDPHFLLGRVSDQVFVLGDHFFLDVSERILFRGPLTLGLNQTTANHAGHATPPELTQAKSLLCGRLRDKVSAAECASMVASTMRRSECHGPLLDCPSWPRALPSTAGVVPSGVLAWQKQAKRRS